MRVNLEKSAKDEHQKAITPDPVKPGESGFSLTDGVFNGAEHLKPLFKPGDYLECEDKDVGSETVRENSYSTTVDRSRVSATFDD